MKTTIISVCLFSIAAIFPSMSRGGDSTALRRSLPRQAAGSSNASPDPFAEMQKSFPRGMKLDQSKRTLEFCPGSGTTCDGFIASPAASISSLKDFAFLYAYFFSDYVDLSKWRELGESITTTQRILAKPEYRDCSPDGGIEEAKCVLFELSKRGAIKLESIHYDKGKRTAVPKDILVELTQ